MLQIAPDTLLQQRYRILSSLGAGGFGRTYLATDRSRFDEYCAIKELTPSTESTAVVAKAKEFFQQEANLLYQLQHPQIPRFWATFEEEDRLFIVQDYIAGKTYARLVDERRNRGEDFHEAEVWRFLLQVLPVLGYIHSKGVIHRDISPENIILRDSDLLPVLIDFGVVKEFADRLQGHPIGRSNISVGKAGYAPPEQLKKGEAYPSSDLYALAVTAIVLLTGKEPSTLFVNGVMNWDWRNWNQISDGLADVLCRMLSVNPRDRYQSGVDVFQALQSLSIPSSPPPKSSELRHPSDRSEIAPTVAVAPDKKPSVVNRVQTALTNLQLPSIWEKPQVFIPLGILVSLLAGFGSWFGVSQLLHSRSPQVQPGKQIDFNNPTIATDTIPVEPVAPEAIEPSLDRPIIKEGLVTADAPVKYRIVAVAGQSLDIQLMTLSDSGASSTSPSAVKGKGISPTPRSLNSNQVLMSILSSTGAPIDPKADRVISWRGQITVSGEYTIELRPIAGLGTRSFPYKLTVNQIPTIVPTSPPTGFGDLPGTNGVVPLPPGVLPTDPTFYPTPSFSTDIPPSFPGSMPIVPPGIDPNPKANPQSTEKPRPPKDLKNTPKPAKKPKASPTAEPDITTPYSDENPDNSGNENKEKP
jgi:serine/threonine protein kinase